MSTPATHVVKVDWKQAFPWLILFQTFGLSFHVRQVFVGMVAALLITLGKWLILGISWESLFALPYFGVEYCSLWPLAPFQDLTLATSWLDETTRTWDQNFEFKSNVSVVNFARCAMMLAWTLLIGGLAGGILARRAALEFAKEESASLWQSTQFVCKRAIDYVSAPFLPLGGVLVLGLCCVLLGLVARAIPYSESFLAAIWISPVVCGILMACLTFAVFAGWPMMVAAVSINAGDGFDALSRGFGFVLDRWRYYAWCVFLLLLYGNVVMRIVLLAIFWGDLLAGGTIGFGFGSPPQAAWNLNSPTHPWRWLVSLFSTGFAYSFFWSGMALTYLLLRKSLDNAELTDIYVDDSGAESDGLAALLNKPPPADPPTLLPIIDLPPGQ